MKRNLLVLFGLIITYGCIAQSDTGFTARAEGIFQIEGKIRNYIHSDNNGFISFRTYDLRGVGKDSAVAIDKDGSFKCTLYQPFEGDMALIYEEEYQDFYMIPAENIFIEIDESKWKKAGNKNEAIVFKGKAAAMAKLIIDYNYDMRKQDFSDQETNLEKSHKPVKEYALLRHALLKKELAFTDQYINKKKISNKKFITWVKNNSIYTAASQIARFGFYGNPNRTNTHRQLMDLLSSIKISNTPAQHNSVYYGFLQNLTGGFQIITNVNPLYKDSIRQMGDNHQLVIMKQIDKYSNGIARQLMYYNLYNAKNKETAFNNSEFDAVITQPYLKSTLKSETEIISFQPYSLIEKIMQFPEAESLITKLGFKDTEQSNELVYMDFWGTWCGPCMLEMPLYPKLIEGFSGKPIRFLFLALENTPEEINNVKTKYGINGRFINLTGNEAAILKNALRFNAVPSHFLVGSSGIVLNNRIGSIVSGDALSSSAINKINETLKMNNNN